MKILTRSVRGKLIFAMLATTFAALLVAGFALLAYDAHNYRDKLLEDLATQADLLARTSAPALRFSDAAVARENLYALRTRPDILGGALYTADNELLATYVRDGLKMTFPSRTSRSGYRIEGREMTLMRGVERDGEYIGAVLVRAHYGLQQRITDYFLILTVVMLGGLLAAALVAFWLQRAVAEPILHIAATAQRIIDKRDFSQRASKRSDDEIGTLVVGFNAMLDEVQRHGRALEQTNQSLQQEMRTRRAAEQALRLADKRKDEFLATLSHELRNPLAPLRNGLEIIALAGRDSAAAERARLMMQRQLTHMVRLVDDLLDVSRIATGKLALQSGRIELQTVIQSAIETVKPLIDSRKHDLRVEQPEIPIYLQGDSTRLSQVFANLLNNAAKYTPIGGSIYLTVQLDEARAIATVRDTGVGLTSAALASIFTMFAQVDQSLDRVQTGLGVGLALSRHLVELHGGSISARSAGSGAGSEFVVTLPTVTNLHTAVSH